MIDRFFKMSSYLTVGSSRGKGKSIFEAEDSCQRFLTNAMIAVLGQMLFMLPAENARAGETIDLRAALIRGADHPLSARARLSAGADEARAKAAHRQSAWPTIGLSGYAERTDALATLDTPLGEFTSGSKSRRQVLASMRVPLVNESARLRAAAAELEANSSGLTSKRARNVYAMLAASYYLDILRLSAQLKSAQSLHQSLSARLERSSALLESGRALRSDLLKVKLEVEQVSQNIVRLQGQLAIAQRQFANAVGSDVALEVAPLTWMPITLEAEGKTNDVAAIEASINEREDIQALKARIDSLSRSADSITAEQRRPNIDFVLQHIERRGVSLFPDHENAAAIQVSIPLFNAGTIEPRRVALLREREALEAAEVDLKRTANLEVEQARTTFLTAQSLRKQAEIGIESASETVNTRRAQYDLGRLQVDDLLTAESELEGQKALFETAAVDIVRAWLNYQFAMGRSMTSLAIPGTK